MHDFLSFRGIELHSKACNPTPNTGLTGLLNGSSEMALGVPGKATAGACPTSQLVKQAFH